jgi:signal transduction histidine kinase
MTTHTISNGTVTKSARHSFPKLVRVMEPTDIVQHEPSLFVTALVHEVRNPLTNINMAVEMLQRLVKDDTYKVYLDIIMRSSVRINDLITELFQHEPTIEAAPEEYSIYQLLEDVLELAEDRLKLKKIIVSKEYVAPDYRIILNKPKMKIALVNIIINSIEAMTLGKGELKLAIKMMDGNYVVQIEDNGCGISNNNLKNIFTPYLQKKRVGWVLDWL